jgi:OCT family organic cation transporter-like MFS transporter 18
VYGLVVLYALCYQLQRPIEPFLVDKLLKGSGTDAVSESESAKAYAKLKGVFSFAQSFGSLAFGFILDRWGVRAGLVINFTACAMCYYILSITDTIELLYLSRLPGVAMAGFLCAQTAVIKLTRKGPARLAALGRLTSAYTIGGVLGPFIGGKLGSDGDYTTGAQLACAGSVLAIALVFFLPAAVDGDVASSSSSSSSSASVSSAQNTEGSKAEVAAAAQQSWPRRVVAILALVWLFLFVKIVTSIANSMARSAQPVILKRLGIKEAGMGTVMSFQFAFGGFANAFLLAPLTRAMGGGVSRVVRNCILVMAFGYVVQAVAYSEAGSAALFGGGPGSGSDGAAAAEGSAAAMMYPFVAMTMLLSILQYSLGTAITAATSGVVPKSMQGTLMGLEHSLFSVAYMVGPQLGVAGLEAGGVSGLSAICAAVFVVVFTVWTLFYRGDAGAEKQKKEA